MVAGVGGKLVANSGPGLVIDQRWMLAGVEPTLVGNLSGVNRVGEQPVEVPARERLPAARDAFRRRPTLRSEPEAVGLLLDPAHAAERAIEREDIAHRFGFDRVDDQCALARIIAERHDTAHPHPLLLRGGNLVANALAGDLALELGK